MTNPVAPGQVSAPITRLEQEVKELRRLVQELQRRDLSNANVGQGGRLRALYANGNEALQVGKDPVDGANKTRISYSSGTSALAIGPGSAAYGSQETLVLRDLAGVTLLTTDELAGYGISNPVLPYGCTVPFNGTSSKVQTLNAEVSVLEAYPTFYHPSIRSQGLITAPNGLVWKYRLRLVDNSGTEVATSSTTTGMSGSQYFDKFLLIPQQYCGAQQMTAQLMVTMTTASGTNAWQVQPSRVLGYSLAYYNLYFGLQ